MTRLGSAGRFRTMAEPMATAGTPGRRVAFYAPMKAPDHPVPSGDREIARLTMAALRRAGFAPEVVSDLRIFDGNGDAAVQCSLRARADAEIERLTADLAARPPVLWFTYHCHYKAPDLVGPAVARALGIPYVLSEPSISPRRREGPWAGFAAASEAAILAADRLFWTTRRDVPALEAAGLAARMVRLAPFVDPGPRVPPRGAGDPVRLLTVAMMRPGDKLESYRRIARGLEALAAEALADGPAPVRWRLDIHGDGPARAEVEALFRRWGDRVVFHGATVGEALRTAYEAADVFLWPGVGEGVGMVYLEAQAAGVPVVAEDHMAQRDVVAGALCLPDDPAAFAAGIRGVARDRQSLGAAAREAVERTHSLEAAAETLRAALTELLT